MRRIANLAIIIILIGSLLSIPSPCFAQNMLRKLGRGVANVVTSPLELPKSIQEVFYEDGPVAAGTYGILEGAFKGIVRIAAGVYEVITFPIPFPADYEPIVEPEFLLSPDEPYSF